MRTADEPLWDWTLRRIRRIWPLGDSGKLKNVVEPDLPTGDIEKLRKKIKACLDGRGGEMSARARAAELGEAYLVLNPLGRRRFLELLATDYDVDNDAVEAAIERRRASEGPEQLQLATNDLRRQLEPPRTRLLRQFNELREGVKFLVDLRAELMPWAREDPALAALDQDVFGLLASWFDIGFLDLQQITWRTPAALLEKLIEYEAVHAIRSWDDLKNRLGDDRCCYAFFHPRMPDEPLIFVEVALVNGISTNIHDLLDEQAPVINPRKADTAIFYSISNCQKGLAGVSFGNFLIKRVVRDLSARMPNLKTFSTLSPIPGFMRWLRTEARDADLSEREMRMLELLQPAEGEPDLLEIIRSGEPAEANNRNTLQGPLLKLCARYLTAAKKGRQALDRVAHFHLANGARIEQINWAADLSDKGLHQSAGMMVNYLYKLPDIEKNHESYSGSGGVAMSSAVRKLL
ncbi:malonyl-CoA decarboxylase [Desulfoprunum benzoelyticum]|nr:malonyl-CoA decarboxylase [Desulfoprunum benzoelyticum]